MDIKEFTESLKLKGYPSPITIKKEGNIYKGPHSHEFETLALILEGEISLDVSGNRNLYKKGDIFHLKSGEIHSEKYGLNGVEYLASRKISIER